MQEQTPKLVLTGFMATGKSAVARVLSRRLSWPLIDVDERIVGRAGGPIATVFAEQGEARFRTLEREAIAALAQEHRPCERCGRIHPAVIATGGGALVDDRNFETLARIGVIVCLSARPEVIAARVRRAREKRPKLLEGGKPLEERIAELIAQRATAYARAAVSIDTSTIDVEQAADCVVRAFEQKAGVKAEIFAGCAGEAAAPGELARAR